MTVALPLVGGEHAEETCRRPCPSPVPSATPSSSGRRRGTARPVGHARCAGLDVHQRSVVACALLTGEEGSTRREVRPFGAMTGDLVALNDWLNGLGIAPVAMESTGVYWRPVFKLLEADHELILVNAQHIKAVPGRKTEVKDREWLADLLRHGL
jgi:transposase